MKPRAHEAIKPAAAIRRHVARQRGRDHEARRQPPAARWWRPAHGLTRHAAAHGALARLGGDNKIAVAAAAAAGGAWTAAPEAVRTRPQGCHRGRAAAAARDRETAARA